MCRPPTIYVLIAMLASVSVTELFCAEDLVRQRGEKNRETEVVEEDLNKKIEQKIELPELDLPKKK